MAGASASSDIIEDNPDEVVLEVLAARPHPTIAVQAPHQGLVAGRPDLNELDDSHVRGERKRKGKGVATEDGESSRTLSSRDPRSRYTSLLDCTGERVIR